MNGMMLVTRHRWLAAHAWLSLTLLLSVPAARAEWPFTMATPSTTAASDGSPVRVFKLAGVAKERAAPWDLLESGPALVMSELLAQVGAETRSVTTRTLVLKMGSVVFAPAQAEELATALGRARKAGKRVVVYLEGAELTTLLASASADRIAMTPEAALLVPGLRAEISFYKDLLGTMGIEADIEAVGQYKSAMEPLTRSTLSEAARANLEALVDGLYQSLVSGIAEPRKLAVEKVKASIDRGLLAAEEAKAAGLVDELAYWDELLLAEKKRTGAASLAWPRPSQAPRIGSLFDLFKLIAGDTAKAAETEPMVAVLVAAGPIVEGRAPGDFLNNESVIAAEDFLDVLHAIESDPLVKALVVRIDSPGGSALASDLIWRELERLDKDLPVIASMGSVAASGGYYIAAAARKIYADRTTLTGSIGVFGGKMVYGGLLEKLGVQTVVIARGSNAGMFSGLGRFSEGERRVMRANMENTYKTFVNRVAKGRRMSFDAVDKVAQGRVWTGQQALEVGLIDKLGGLDDAVREAARLSRAWPQSKEPRVAYFPKARTLFELLGSSADNPMRLRFGGQLMALAQTLPRPIAADAQRLARVVESLCGREPVLAMLPFALELR